MYDTSCEILGPFWAEIAQDDSCIILDYHPELSQPTEVLEFRDF